MKTIGDYRLKKQIAEGGMGAIFLASHVKTNQPVAIKVIKADLSSNEHFIIRFKREIDTSKQFAHPYVVKIIDGGLIPENDTLYLVMEYLKGKTLSKVFKNRTATQKDAINIMLHIAEALSYIHQRGIIHRDIKPDNLLVVSQERTVLLDFGLSLSGDLTRISRTADRPGTFSTMSPEQLQGKEIDCRSDIYSLGCTMYKILTGAMPYNFNQITGIAAGRISHSAKPPVDIFPNISLKLSNIIVKCIALTKEHRFSSAEELIKALKSKEAPLEIQKTEISHTPIQASLVKNLPPESSPSSRFTRMRTIFMMFLILTLGFTFWSLMVKNKSSLPLTSSSQHQKAAELPDNAPSSALAFMYLNQPSVPDTQRCTILGEKVKNEKLGNRPYKMEEFEVIGLNYLYHCAKREEMPQKAFTYIKTLVLRQGFRAMYKDPYYCYLELLNAAKNGGSVEDLKDFYRKLKNNSKDNTVVVDSTLALVMLIQECENPSSTPPVSLQEQQQEKLHESYYLCKGLLKDGLQQDLLVSLIPVYYSTLWSLNDKKYKDEGIDFFKSWINKAELHPDLALVLYLNVSILITYTENDIQNPVSEADNLKGLNYAMKAFNLSNKADASFLSDTTINLARSYICIGKDANAIQTCESMLKTHPEFANQIHFVREYGKMLRITRNSSKAIEWLSSFLERMNNNSENFPPVDETSIQEIHSMVNECKRDEQHIRNFKKIKGANLLDLESLTGEIH